MTEKGAIFKNKIMSGPMVRGSSLTFRLSCLEYGADLVYSPGLVDLAINSSELVESNGTYKLIKKDNGDREKTIFITTPQEKEKLVIQLVSVDGANALKAVNKLEGIPVAFDLNCGCPESFACHRGGGSAITLENAVDVVKTISSNSPTPVSVKMRIRDTVEESIQFARAMEAAGASALTVHGRLASNKRKGGVDFEHMKAIFEAVGTAKIGNGGVTSLEDAAAMKAKTGCDSVMIASAASHCPAVFATTRPRQIDVVARMAAIGREAGEDFREAKWSLTQAVVAEKELNLKVGEAVGRADSWDAFDAAIAGAL